MAVRREMMRVPFLLAVVLLAASFAGCATSEREGDGLAIPYPSAGDHASYEAKVGTLDVTIHGPHVIRDVSGKELTTQRVEHELRFRAGGTTSWNHFLDANGNRTLVQSPCEMLGSYFVSGEPDSCGSSSVSSANYLESGLPGVFGAAALWGTRLNSPTVTLHAAIAGQTLHVTYVVDFVEIEGTPCADLTTGRADDLRLFTRFVSYAGSIPTRLLICDQEAFPREVSLIDEGSFLRVGYERRQDDATPRLDVGATFDQIPFHPQSREVNPLAPFPEYDDPMGLSLQEALDAWRRDDLTLTEYLSDHRDARVYTSLGNLKSSSNTLNVIQARAVERSVAIIAADGSGLRGVVQKSCVADRCETNHQSTEGKSYSWIASRPLGPTLSMNAIGTIASRILEQTPISFKTYLALPAQGHALGAGDRYFIEVDTGLSGRDWRTALVDASTGAVLWLQAPHSTVEGLTGVKREALMH